MNRYRCGLVALSADPITFGHLDLIRQAKERCDSIVVLVANNDLKAGQYLFSLDERTTITTEAIRQSGIGGTRVIGSSGLLVDVYLREGCDALFRGIRNVKDAEYEEEQMELHTYILPELRGHIVYLESREEYRIISSSLVKAFVRSHVDVSRFVPIFVKQLLEERMNGQYLVAVTGCQAVGKSYVSEALANEIRSRGQSAVVISVDALVRELYDEESDGAQLIRDAIATTFGKEILSEDRKHVDRRAFKQKLFHPETKKEDRENLHQMVEPHIARLYRDALRGKRGLVIVEWAQLAEMNLSYWTNYHSIVVTSDDGHVFAQARSIEGEEADRIALFQWSSDEKVEALYRIASGARHGVVIRFSNKIGDTVSLSRLANSVFEIFPGLVAHT